MTQEQKDRVWAVLPEDAKEEMREKFAETRRASEGLYDGGWNDAVNFILIKLFGKTNLSQEDNKEIDTEDVWRTYKMELAKTLAMTMMKSKGWVNFDVLMEIVRNIVNQLKGDDDV